MRSGTPGPPRLLGKVQQSVRTYGMLVGGCCAVVLSLVMVSPRVASADTGTMTAVEQQHLDDLTPVGVRELAPAGDGW